jgi:predicted permease
MDSHHISILRMTERPRPIRRVFVTVDLLRLLGVRPLSGRLFDVRDFTEDAPRVALVTDALWRTQLGSGADTIGQNIHLDDQIFTVIGVLPSDVLGFLEPREELFEERDTERCVLTPLVKGTGGEDERMLEYHRHQRDAPWLRVVARLQPNVSLKVAQAEMDVIARRLATQHPTSNEGRSIRVRSLDAWRTSGIRHLLLMLAGAGALVFLATSINAAGLILIDTARRETELAIRRALGAGTHELVRLVLLRSIIWSLPGIFLALLFGGLILFLVERSSASAGTYLPGLLGVPWVITGGAILTLLAGLVAGLMSVWQLRSRRLADTLREGSLTASSSRYRRFAVESLVSLQVAVAIALVFSAGLLLHSMWNILSVDPGYDVEHGLVVQVRLPSARYPSQAERQDFYQRALARIRSLPSVESAGLSGSAPLTGTSISISGNLTIETAQGTTKQLQRVNGQFVTSGYIESLGLHLIRGYGFTEDHYHSNAPVVLVDEAFCRQHLRGTDPLGSAIHLGTNRLAIIGVVGNVRQFGLSRDVPPTMYLLHSQSRSSRWAFFVVRSSTRANSIADALVREIQTVEPAACLDEPRTLASLFAENLAERRRILGLVGSSATIALLLSTLSLVGALGQFVSGHTRAIATRIVLGAAPRHIVFLLCGYLSRALLVGTIVGVAGGFSLAVVLSSQLFGLTWADPVTLAATFGMVVGLAIAAAAAPARRAITVDPAHSLRVQ